MIALVATVLLSGMTVANIARSKPAYSSSLHVDPSFPVVPFNAVDGNTNGNWPQGSCFSTVDNDMNPWWMVDLLDNYIIDNITVYNRVDTVPERLHDFRIEVFTTNPVRCPGAAGLLCLQYDGTFDSSVETLYCDYQVIGRFLRFTKFTMNDGVDLFTLCEIVVEGTMDSTLECSWMNYPKVSNTRLVHAVSETSTESLAADCAVTCYGDESCLGFNYGRYTGQCEKVVEPTSADIRDVNINFDYYGRDLC